MTAADWIKTRRELLDDASPGPWEAGETQRDHDRRELTERFANQRQTRTGAINELSALLDAEDERVRLTAEAIETARTEDFVISGRIRID